MKNLLVLTAVSAILVASGSAMASGSSGSSGSTPSVTPPAVAVPNAAAGITNANSAATVSMNQGSSAAAMGISGQVANISGSAMSGASTYDYSHDQKTAATTATAGVGSFQVGSTNSGTSLTTVGSTFTGTSVDVKAMNVENKTAGGTTTQGIENKGTAIVAIGAAALPAGGSNHGGND